MTDAWWNPVAETIERFKKHATESGPGDGRLQRLASMLDQLALLYPKVPDAAPEQETEPPAIHYNPVYRQIGAQYPELGYYWSVDPLYLSDTPEPPGLDDAIDDLADIYCDLSRVEWFAENGRFDEAAWEFRFGYQTHWGKHLHQLRCHLHWKLYD